MPKSIDEYLASVPSDDARSALENLRRIILDVVPDAEEIISYQIPAYKFHGILVGFAAFKNHCSFFPFSGHTVKDFQKQLKEFKTSKATIQFTPSDPLPEDLVRLIVNKRVAENIANRAESKRK